MATSVHRAFDFAATSGAVRFVLAAVLVTIWTKEVDVSPDAGAYVPSADKLERITEFFNNEIATGKLPGAVVLIQQHGKPVYLKCFGVRDVVTNIPMTPDTIFALHSMTKPITSLAAMMLIDAGKLSLSDPVSKFFPGFADVRVGVSSVAADGTPVLKLVPLDRPVTIMDLLRHTSGVTYDYIGGKLIDKAYSDSGLFDGYFDNRVFAERIANLPLARQPGTLWRSTDVIGRIIEIISGQSLYQFERQHIFDPLGMTSTSEVPTNARGWRSRCLATQS
jgi:CubicO group peptidase (beta-lactamase class C family)